MSGMLEHGHRQEAIVREEFVGEYSDEDSNCECTEQESNTFIAEVATLLLPSSFSTCQFPDQCQKEISLRQGQATDALHNLRIVLTKKSFLF